MSAPKIGCPDPRQSASVADAALLRLGARRSALLAKAEEVGKEEDALYPPQGKPSEDQLVTLRKIERRWNALHDRADRLSDEIRSIPATSLGGIAVKLRVFRDRAEREFGSSIPTDDDFNPSILLGFSALADAERLIAQAGR
jgi:hypothetical protein